MPPIEHVLGGLLRDLGAPILGEVVGKITTPSIGNVARRGVEIAAEALGVPATPEAVTQAAQTNPNAATVLQEAERANLGELTNLARVFEIEAQRAADAERAEIERGFGSWQARRTVTTYLLLGLFAVSFVASLGAALGLWRADGAVLSMLVTTAATVWGAWQVTLSGTKGITEAVRAWRGGR